MNRDNSLVQKVANGPPMTLFLWMSSVLGVNWCGEMWRITMLSRWKMRNAEFSLVFWISLFVYRRVCRLMMSMNIYDCRTQSLPLAILFGWTPSIGTGESQNQNGPDTSIEVEPTSYTVRQLELVYLLDALNGGRYSNGMICIFLRFCSSSHNRWEFRHYGKI